MFKGGPLKKKKRRTFSFRGFKLFKEGFPLANPEDNPSETSSAHSVRIQQRAEVRGLMR
jgi:hypothetical protein